MKGLQILAYVSFKSLRKLDKRRRSEEEENVAGLTKTVQRKWSKWKDDSMCGAGQEKGRTITLYSQL